MKSKFILAGLLALVLSVASYAQTSEPMYYVTIGVYGVHDYAIKFTDQANKNNFSAQYAINPARKLYYVYIYSSTDKAKAVAFMLKIRLETNYKDAWVFGGTLGEGDAPVTDVPKTPPVKEPEVKPEPPVVTKPVVTDSIKETPPVVKIDSPAVKPPVEKPVEKPVEVPVVKHEGKPFFFKLVNQETGEEIIGEVHVQESVKATQYQAFRGNEVVYIKPPVNSQGTYTIVTQAPGYQQVKSTVVFANPTNATVGANNEYIVPLDLKRAKHGDYIDFNHVKFVRNSSVMTPDSQGELDGLILLMKENANYHVKIHGHTNGKADREIVLRGTSQEYFQMDPANNKKETTTAMVLSEERAKSVKDYMVSKGVDASRISTKGEGGRIPLYAQTSTLASYNDRVEVEIKKN